MSKPLNIYFLIGLTLIDVLCYGILHEKYGFNFFWTFTYQGIVIYPLYRIFQGILDIGACYWVWKKRGWYQLGGMVLAWFCAFKECLYYIILWQWELVKTFHNPYWLERPYYLLYYLGDFTAEKFMICFIVACVLLIISNLIRKDLQNGKSTQ